MLKYVVNDNLLRIWGKSVGSSLLARKDAQESRTGRARYNVGSRERHYAFSDRKTNRPLYYKKWFSEGIVIHRKVFALASTAVFEGAHAAECCARAALDRVQIIKRPYTIEMA
ncbi:hypothetical protein EVAR_24873_1 [Eumeta japonica]|uniref:Uncharacterized protein n=1 Tax=Eumeta variegata TaxID=151549 RepID=A0A4C1V5S6_EUMVA|nr:hypothetical protein EVAR_24873_1 [Eumeta japonica]